MWCRPLAFTQELAMEAVDERSSPSECCGGSKVRERVGGFRFEGIGFRVYGVGFRV